MTKLIALTIVAAAAIYFESDGNLFFGLLLPLAGLITFVYAFTLPGSLIIGLGALIFHFIDIGSPSPFFSVLLPIFFGANILLFVFWADKAGLLAGAGGADPYVVSGGGGGDGGGGDGGGC